MTEVGTKKRNAHGGHVKPVLGVIVATFLAGWGFVQLDGCATAKGQAKGDSTPQRGPTMPFDPSTGLPIVEGIPAVGCLCGATYQKVGDDWGCVGADPLCHPSESTDALGTTGAISTAPEGSVLGIGADGEMAWVTHATGVGSILGGVDDSSAGTYSPPPQLTGDIAAPLTFERQVGPVDWAGWIRVRGGALIKWYGDEIGWEAVTLQPEAATPPTPRVVPLSVSDSGVLDLAKSEMASVTLISADDDERSIPVVLLGMVTEYGEGWTGPREPFYSEALPISLAIPAGAEQMEREKVGHAACDDGCGKRNAGLATPDGCWCWRPSATNWRESRWERLP